MRLSLSDFAALPYACALVDRDGGLLQHTPEWRGRGLGALSFEAGAGSLVVTPDGASSQVDGLVSDLLDALTSAAACLDRSDRMAVEMLVAALAMVAGRERLAAAPGAADEVLERAKEGLRRSLPALRVATVVDVECSVPMPAAIALGLVQLARNAARHGGAEAVTLRAARGPTFRVEWAAPGAATPVPTARRPDQRRRWGMGYARLLGDALGGVVTAPVAVRPGVVASSIGLGSPRFSVPVAAVVGGHVERASRAWDEETGLAPGDPVDERVRMAVDAAASRPGEVAVFDVLRARSTAERCWVGVAVQSSLGRARDVLRGIQHENTLLTAAEPHATRVYAISTLLGAVVGGDHLEAVPPATWARDFPAACRALGLPVADPLDADRLRYPDPRVTAFLVSTLQGTLAESPAGPPGPVIIRPSAAARGHHLVRLLGEPDGILVMAS
ncbi:MAG: hypothetical protein NVSMB17_05990 [Candidatus Dormibacteria bacterium]